MFKPILILLCFAALARAVTTSHWTHTSEADFAAGQMQGVVASNLGDLKLSRALKSIFAPDARISAVHALAQGNDGTIFAGTGPQGILLKIQNDVVSDAANFGDNVNLFSLLVEKSGALLVGTGGERGEVFRIEKTGEEPKKIFTADGVQYVWSMLQSDDGTVYLATGPTGQLWSISPDGKQDLVYDSTENNILCLQAGGGDLIYAGTDPNGLLLRINKRTKQAFVVYDAAESEISALAIMPNGDLLAATAQATVEGAELPTAVEQTGRPEPNVGGVPLQAAPPENPKPPEVPEPPPSEPKPIPKFMSILDDEDAATAPAIEVAEVAPTPARASAAAITPAAAGNAVYRIDRDGFVTEIFRANVAIFALLAQNGDVLAATGAEGNVFQLRPAAEETLALAKVDPKEVMCLLAAKDGRVFLGCANRGDIAVMTSGYASTGTYTSAVLDATQISRFGQMHLRGRLPDGSALKVSTRSGNVADPAGSGWSDWTDPVSAAEYLPVTAPPARFLQYKLSFESADGSATALVEDVDVAYQLPNLAPKITAVRIAPGDVTNADARPKVTISWDAADPNIDALRYTVQLRNRPAGEWVTIKDKLDQPTHEFDTRTTADGRYELRISATDAAANPPGSALTATRTSELFIVDNTPPVIGDVGSAVENAVATINFSVVDRTSTVSSVEYAVDGAEDWQSVLPADMMADSPKEAYEFKISGLKPGPHQVALRATDSAGNRSFANVTVELK